MKYVDMEFIDKTIDLIKYNIKKDTHDDGETINIEAVITHLLGLQTILEVESENSLPTIDKKTAIGPPKNPTPLDKQIGGNHYKDKKIQPWEIIDLLDLNFYEGNALKYLLRYKEKNGSQDLRKAIHYIEKIINDRGDK